MKPILAFFAFLAVITVFVSPSIAQQFTAEELSEFISKATEITGVSP